MSILNWITLVVVPIYLVALSWLSIQSRKRERSLIEIRDTFNEINRTLSWFIIQRNALGQALWSSGTRGVFQAKSVPDKDDPEVKVVTVSVTSNAVVVSCPGEEEFVMKMEG